MSSRAGELLIANREFPAANCRAFQKPSWLEEGRERPAARSPVSHPPSFCPLTRPPLARRHVLSRSLSLTHTLPPRCTGSSVRFLALLPPSAQPRLATAPHTRPSSPGPGGPHGLGRLPAPTSHAACRAPSVSPSWSSHPGPSAPALPFHQGAVRVHLSRPLSRPRLSRHS